MAPLTRRYLGNPIADRLWVRGFASGTLKGMGVQGKRGGTAGVTRSRPSRDESVFVCRGVTA
jgi:hypothetical protein